MQRFIKFNLRVQPRPKRRKRKAARIDWQPAPDVDKRIKYLAKNLDLDWLNKDNIHSFRSKNSKTRAYARIWGLPRIWQKALQEEASYIIEVISEKYDRLSEKERDKVLLHEIVHIPKNFSGSLIPHYRKGKRNFHNKVEVLVKQYMQHRKGK
jgi:predicted metallopeptidase